MSDSDYFSYPGDKETFCERVDSTDYNWRRIGIHWTQVFGESFDK